MPQTQGMEPRPEMADASSPASSAESAVWPPLPWDAWKDTCETLHMWTQVIGKVKLELVPFLNQLWQVGFHLTARGLTTGLIPTDQRVFEVRFDFIAHNLEVAASDGQVKTMPLIARSVADFYQEIVAVLAAMGIEVRINTTPVEVPNPIPFEQDHVHAAYDPVPVHRWWRVMTQTATALQRYRSSFIGKSSPILFYWGSFDLSEARYAGRPAPALPDAPRFYQLAEDEENVACGFWPGNPSASGVTFAEPAFYSYIMPAPNGYREASVQPKEAHFDDRLGEFILRYDDARRAASPEQALLDFFQSAYDAGATLARWDRSRLERPSGGGPRPN